MSEEFEIDDDALALAAGGFTKPSPPSTIVPPDPNQYIYSAPITPGPSNFPTHHLDEVSGSAGLGG